MADRRQSLRPTGLPKPSRLPMMSPASAIPSPSAIPTPSFSSSTSRAPSIRPAQSKERLSTSIGSPAGDAHRASKLRPVASRSRLSLQPTPSKNSSASSSGMAAPKALFRQPSSSRLAPPKAVKAPTTTPSSTIPPLRKPNDTNIFQRPPPKPLSRRTSNQHLVQPEPTSTSPIEDPPASIREGKGSGLGEAEEALIGEAIREKTRRPRPSLSERTIETLALIPSSPAIKGRPSQASSFYDPDGLRRPPSRPSSRSTGSRPGSSYQSDNSSNKSGSRPHSQHDQEDSAPNFRASTNSFRSAGLPSFLPIDEMPGSRGSVSLSSRTLRAPSSRTSLGPGSLSHGFAGARRSLGPGAKPPGPPTRATVPLRARTPSPEKKSALPGALRTASTPGKIASKSFSARPLKPRPSLNGLLPKPKPSLTSLGPATRNSSVASRTSSTSYDTSNISNASTALTADSNESASPPTGSRKSSAALREQIAKAKAAKRTAMRQGPREKDSIATSSAAALPTSPTPETFSRSVSSAGGADQVPLVPTDTTFDFGLAGDPFGQKRNDKSLAKVIQARVETARTTGRLNIAALSLKDIPEAVINMYNAESIRENGGSWAESVDLTRFVGADNEIEAIDDSVFPDIDPEQVDDSEDGHGNIFGGLETLDLHGNGLISLPLGLRRLPMLTSLNLSQNRITNSAMEIISQITSLRNLKLGNNLFYGPLDPCFAKLENLEIADLHGNNISALPLNLGSMAKLRILNISENDIGSLLFEPLSQLPLTELIARKNKLSGTLIEDSVTSLPKLQVLDVSSNQIAHLVSSSRTNSLDMPAIYQLCVTMNRLQELPNMSSWPNLLTLSADENTISSVPEGFTALAKLRHVDFSSNDIRVIPPEIGRMENLAMLRLGGNPLRDKKFCTATTDDLKETLLARLEPEEQPDARISGDGMEDELRDAVSMLTVRPASTAHRRQRSTAESVYSENETFATPPTSVPHTPIQAQFQHASRNSMGSNSQLWPVTPDGVLDRSSTESSALHPVIASKVAQSHTVRKVYLQKNSFTVLPDSLSFFAETLTVLSLAHNQLHGESYLGDAGASLGLDLPVLTELNLSANHITSLAPLVRHLRAPRLQKLDVSLNKVAVLPGTQQGVQSAEAAQGTSLRALFPALTVLLAANNRLAALDPESIRGMQVVDVSNNDIEHLDPRIGLLGSGGSGKGVGDTSGTLQRLDVGGNRFRVPRYDVLERGTEATLKWLRGHVPSSEMAAWRAANQQDGDDDD